MDNIQVYRKKKCILDRKRSRKEFQAWGSTLHIQNAKIIPVNHRVWQAPGLMSFPRLSVSVVIQPSIFS
jgi:hypothetical protein